MRACLRSVKDTMGTNVAALEFLQREIQANTNAYFFGERDAASSASAAPGASSASKKRGAAAATGLTSSDAQAAAAAAGENRKAPVPHRKPKPFKKPRAQRL